MEPVLLVPGEYKPPSADPDARKKLEAALGEEQGKPQFNGNVNGFRIYGYGEERRDPSVGQKECVAESFPEVNVFQLNYLPLGTAARSPQYAGTCADGSMAWVTQDFVFKYGTFSVGYELGERAIGTDATAGRVSAATIAGRPGVIISPLTTEGNGGSTVAFQLTKGFIGVAAQNLPLSETLKIAEGITCADC